MWRVCAIHFCGTLVCSVMMCASRPLAGAFFGRSASALRSSPSSFKPARTCSLFLRSLCMRFQIIRLTNRMNVRASIREGFFKKVSLAISGSLRKEKFFSTPYCCL